jgi:hypothetical protein
MSLMPEIERELLDAAQEHAESESYNAAAEKRLTAPAKTIALLAVVGIAVGVVLLVLPSQGRHLSARNLRAALGTPPHNAWWLGGRGCPIAGPSRDVPRRSGCVTRIHPDVNGDGRPDRILLYAHLSTRRAGQGFIPTYFTLEVLLAGGGKFTARIGHLRANVTVDGAGDVNDRAGAELFLTENRFRAHGVLLAPARQLVLVYSFDRQELIRAGSFWWWGDATRKYGITCHEHRSPVIVQHEFLRQGRVWRRIDTTYRWFGASLRQTATVITRRRMPPPQNLTTVDCRFA